MTWHSSCFCPHHRLVARWCSGSPPQSWLPRELQARGQTQASPVVLASAPQDPGTGSSWDQWAVWVPVPGVREIPGCWRMRNRGLGPGEACGFHFQSVPGISDTQEVLDTWPRGFSLNLPYGPPSLNDSGAGVLQEVVITCGELLSQPCRARGSPGQQGTLMTRPKGDPLSPSFQQPLPLPNSPPPYVADFNSDTQTQGPSPSLGWGQPTAQPAMGTELIQGYEHQGASPQPCRRAYLHSVHND